VVRAHPRLRRYTFEEYLTYEDNNNSDHRYELIDGELVPLAPESGLNSFIAQELLWVFAIARLAPRSQMRIHDCEVQVPVLQKGDAANRYPDFVVLRKEHWQLTQKRQTITLEMPPPRLVAKVVSPYKSHQDDNYRRDYRNKRLQYAARGIPEYWIVDPTEEQVVVLQLESGKYVETVFRGDSRLISPVFPALDLTAQQVFDVAE